MNATNKLLVLITLTFLSCNMNSQDKSKYNKLSPEEESVIVFKGTERPFSGKYYQNQDTGIYVCKRCNAPLYRSTDKFDAHCGWPSFDDEIKGAIKRKLDSDGQRTEILCANCGAHLGHVFVGEHLTDKNIRNCVNSISLDFKKLPLEKVIPNVKTDTAIFAGGCFWGVEYYFKNVKGVISTEVGFSGGRTENPTYYDVCNKSTGHAEVIQVIYDTTKTNFEELAKLFFEIHDPTQVNRQGPDIGIQYRSAIFYTNENQKEIAEKLVKILESKGLKISTEITKASKFYPAEEYHQDYYTKKSGKPYCHIKVKRF